MPRNALRQLLYKDVDTATGLFALVNAAADDIPPIAPQHRQPVAGATRGDENFGDVPRIYSFVLSSFADGGFGGADFSLIAVFVVVFATLLIAGSA